MQALLGGGFQLNLAAGYMDAYYTSLNPACSTTPTATVLASSANGLQTTQGGGGFTLEQRAAEDAEVQGHGQPDLGPAPAEQQHAALPGRLHAHGAACTTTGRTPRCWSVRRRTSSNASIHWMPASEHFEFVVGGTNLTDDRYLTVGSANYTAGEVVGTYSAPRSGT